MRGASALPTSLGHLWLIAGAVSVRNASTFTRGGVLKNYSATSPASRQTIIMGNAANLNATVYSRGSCDVSTRRAILQARGKCYLEANCALLLFCSKRRHRHPRTESKRTNE